QGESPVTYAYDESAYQSPIGRLTTINDASGTTHYSYLPLGEIAVAKKTVDNTDFTQTYAYDHGGRLTHLGDPDWSLAQYTYTDGGNLSTAILNSVTQATWANYDANGAPHNVTYGNNVSTTYARDVVEHLTHLTTITANPSPGTVLQDLSFDWYYTNTN